MILPNIIRAATEGKLLKISFMDKKGVHTNRTIEPYEIRDGVLFAHCRVKNGIRQFALNQIIQAIVLKETYTPRYPVKINGPSV